MASDAPMTPSAAELLALQQRSFDAGHTLARTVRETQLKRLLDAIVAYEPRILEALALDLGKCRAEAYSSEVGIVRGEIKHTLKHLAGWMRPTSDVPPLATWPATAAVHPEPLGPTLIIAPWNYPFQLAMAPLVAALAAGNPAVIKPSELAPATAEVVADLVASTFPVEQVACVLGGVEASTELLAQPFKHVFFTGSTRVGKIVAKAAAEHLSRVTLELGGKSPCIVTRSANLDTAARRIVFGKFLNAGQTCVAPDYLLVERPVKDALIEKMGQVLAEFYGADPQRSPDYGRIVNGAHHARLVGLLDGPKVVVGGTHDADDRYLAPTILDEVTWEHPVMQEEIFGPILPVLSVESLDQALAEVRKAPEPLALYLFSEEAAEADLVTRRVRFGGGCINSTVLHLIDPNLPFGGVGQSGQGAYHGHAGFLAFSHGKSMLSCSSAGWADLSLKYPPYSDHLAHLRLLVG